RSWIVRVPTIDRVETQEVLVVPSDVVVVTTSCVLSGPVSVLDVMSRPEVFFDAYTAAPIPAPAPPAMAAMAPCDSPPLAPPAPVPDATEEASAAVITVV